MNLRKIIGSVVGEERGLTFGLRMKLLLLITVVIVLVSSLITYFYQARIRSSFFWIQTRSLASQLEFVGKVGKGLFADIVQGRSSIDRFFEDLEKHNPDVRFFVIRSARGETLYERIPNPSYRSFANSFVPPEEPRTVQGEVEIAGEKIVYVAVPVEVTPEFTTEPLELLLSGSGISGLETLKGKSSYHWIVGGASAQRIVEEFYHFRFQLLKYTIPTTLVILVFFYLLLGQMVSPLMKMVRAAREISEGQFHERVEIISEDEVGILAHSFNLMVERLASLFEQIRASSANLGTVVEKLVQAAEDVRQGASEQSSAVTETTSSLEEMNRNINDLAQNMEELKNSVIDSRTSILEMSTTIGEIDEHMRTLAANVDTNTEGVRTITRYFDEIKEKISVLQQASQETATATNQVDKNIQEIKNSNRDVAQLMESVVKLSESGRDYVQRTSQGIAEIERRFSMIRNAALSLSKKGEEIRNIIETVREIADQTNLLALNAAIIAAQAGESGKQFTVIAHEIKALSDRSQSSIKEIRKHVDSVASESKKLVEIVAEGAGAVEQGKTLALDSETLLGEIHRFSGQVREEIDAIARATQEQSSGSHQVNESVQNIFRMVDEIQKNIGAQEEQIRGIRESAEKMQNIATVVRNSTAENKKGSQRVNLFIEKVNLMVEQIAQGLKEQKSASERIQESAQAIHTLARKNQDLALRFSDIVRTLHEEIEKFQNLTMALQEEGKIWQ